MLTKQKAFTLLELLIVIVIISIVSTIAFITLSFSSKKNIEDFAHQLVQVITLAEHEAILRPATIGLGFTKQSYQFYDFSSKWQRLNDSYLKKYSISHSIEINLKVNGEEIELNGKPVIVISQSSDITPFIISLAEKGKSPSYQITGNASGALTIESIEP